MAHNGGRSQVNLAGIRHFGDYPFMNMMKAASTLTCNSSVDGFGPDPDILDINGYPTANTGGQGYSTLLIIPRQIERPGRYILEWDGTGTFVDSSDGSGITGSFSTSGVKFIPYSNQMGLSYSTSASPNHVRNIRFYHEDDATEFAAGEVFGSKLRARLREANFGVIRYMDWQNNNTNNAAKWADNKATTCYSYYVSEYRGSAWGADKWYHGVTTSSGGAYSISTSRGRSPVNGDIMQLKFDTDAGATITAAVSSGSNTVLTIATSAPNTTFGTVGESVTVGVVSGSWSGMNGTWTVQARSAGSVTINFDSHLLTPGALAGATDRPLQLYHTFCTLNVDGGGAVNILDPLAGALSTGGNSYPCRYLRNTGSGGGDAEYSGYYCYATLVYNSAIPGWIKQGGDRTAVTGLNNYTPPQLGLQLAAEMGAHPWFCMPIQSMDPMTDYVTQLATYCRDNGPSWMVPRFEPPNECFNNSGGFQNNGNCKNRSAAYGWPSATDDYVHVYGKFASTMGQDLQTVYGTGTTNRAKYVFLAGVQTVTRGSAAQQNILTSAMYLAQVPAAQSGYNKTTPASSYLHGIAVANYYAPSNYHTTQSASELAMANAYAAGDVSQVPAYIALCQANSPDDGLPGFNIYANQADFSAWASAAIANGVFVMEFYEGGFSPDYVSGDTNTNLLKGAARDHASLGPVVLADYAICTGTSGGGLVARFPSHYYLSGNKHIHSEVSQSVWSLLDDISETPGSAQWLAIVAYNQTAKFVNLRLRIHA